MPQPPTLFPKPYASTRFPGVYSATSAMASFSRSGFSQHTADISSHQQIFRAKRKHVLKACDRCRVKKTKVRLYLSSLGSCSVAHKCFSATETSPVIAARHTTTRVYFERERRCKRRLIQEGEDLYFHPLLIYRR